ncbi:MAG TPA: HAD family hydrolase [Candidatus Dormibacteraeota bacterium]|nr:HAD family hydrolase [Candidatus Dormibacteraeota bacterium]
MQSVHSLPVTRARRKFHARVVLLDWDGTLLDSYAADSRAYMAMFRALKIKWGEAELKQHYCPNWYEVYRAARVPRSKWRLADRLWREAYSEERPKLLPGARSVVRALARRFRLGLVTSGSRDRVRQQIVGFGFEELFAACVFSEDCTRKKPHPAALHLALKRLSARAEDCVYVGDAAEDIEMARRAGVRPIGVLGPFPTAERIRAAQPDLLLETIRDLPLHLRAANC